MEWTQENILRFFKDRKLQQELTDKEYKRYIEALRELTDRTI